MRPAASSRSPADPDRPPARPTEVAFEPTRLGGGPGRREPAIAVGIVAAIFIGLAIAKPWDWGGPTGIASVPSASTVPSASSGSAPSGSTGPDASGVPDAGQTPPAGQIRVAPPPIVSWDDVAPALSAHDTWGIRALVDSPNLDGGIRPIHATLTERWEAAAPAIDGALGSSLAGRGAVSEAVLLPTAGERVRVIGVTAPAGRMPLDVRVWWLQPGEPPRWLDARPVDPDVPGSHLLLLPPRRPDGTAERWPAGAYRLDVLLGSAITQFTVVLPPGEGRFGLRDVPDPFGADVTAAAPMPDPLLADLVGLESGPFVVAYGQAVSVNAPLADSLDEPAAWLDAETGLSGSRRVGQVWQPDATGIGLTLAVGARLEWAALERLAPAALFGVDAAARPIRVGSGSISTVVFSQPDGSPWPAGAYALDVRWIEEGETFAGRWHLDLVPGPLRRSGVWARAVRAWARHAGTWGIVSGTAEPLEGGPSGVAIRIQPQLPTPTPASPGPEGLGERCAGGALLDTSRPVFGIAYPANTAIAGVTVERLFAGGRRVSWPVASSVAVVPGLTIVGPLAELTLDPGYYRVRLRGPDGETSLVVCLGEARRARSAVDPATATAEAFEAALAAVQTIASTTR